MATILISRSFKSLSVFKNRFFLNGSQVSRLQGLLATPFIVNFNRSVQGTALSAPHEPTRTALSVPHEPTRTALSVPHEPTNFERLFNTLENEARLRGRVSKKHVDLVMDNLNRSTEWISPNKSKFLLSCLGDMLPEETKEKRIKHVQNLWHNLLIKSAPMDISYYNTLLQVHLENNLDFLPEDFLSILKEADVHPDRITYQFLIKHYCQKGDIDGALQILKFMKENELSVDEMVFNSLILGHGRANDTKSAHEILSIMENLGLSPSSVTIMNLMICHAENGDIKGVFRVFEEYEDKFHLTNQILMEVIFALTTSGHGQHAPEILEKLQLKSGLHADGKNLVLRLLAAGHDDVAFLVVEFLQELDTSSLALDHVKFYLRNLIQFECYSVQTIVNKLGCFNLRNNMDVIGDMLRTALATKPEMAAPLMKLLEESGVDIRTHYFWPLFTYYRTHKNKKNIYMTIEDMLSMNVEVDQETCSEFIWPILLEMGEKGDSIIEKLDTYLKPTFVRSSAIRTHLNNSDIKTAADICKKYDFYVHYGALSALHKICIETGDVKNAALLVSHVFVPDDRVASGKGSNEDNSAPNFFKNIFIIAKAQFPGKFLLKFLNELRRVYSKNMTEYKRHIVNTFIPLLKAMIDEYVYVDPDTRTPIQDILGQGATDEINSLLDKLFVKGSLELAYTKRFQDMGRERLYNVKHLRKMIHYFVTMLNFEKVEEIMQEVKDQNVRLNVGTYLTVIEMYLQHSQVEKACDTYKALKSAHKSPHIKDNYLLHYYSSFMSSGNIEEALEVLKDFSGDLDSKQAYSIIDMFMKASGKSCLALSKMEQLVEILMTHLISSHEKRKLFNLLVTEMELDGAMAIFQHTVKTRSSVVSKMVFTKACIVAKDTEKLQNILDLDVSINGAEHAEIDMGFAFVEMGKVEEALKIVNNHRFADVSQKLNRRGNYLFSKKDILHLENLLEFARRGFVADHTILYTFLLKLYSNAGDCDKAIGLFMTMLEDNISVNSEFIVIFTKLLKTHRREFFLPKHDIANPLHCDMKLLYYIEMDDLTNAVDVIKKMDADERHRNLSQIVELMKKFSHCGEFDAILSMRPYIDKVMHSKYYESLTLAYVKAGCAEVALDKLSSWINDAGDETKELSNYIFENIWHLLKEELLPKVITLSNKYNSVGIFRPMNILLLHYIKDGYLDDAKKVYDEYFRDNPGKIDIDYIQFCVEKSRDTKYIAQIMEFFDYTPEVDAKRRTLETWINILCDIKNYQGAMKVIKVSLEEMDLSDYRPSVLDRVKVGLALSGETFPYTLDEEV